MIKVSVVMATYHDADRLADTIESVLSQTCPDFEFIIVNDGSTDRETINPLSCYEKKDGRIRIIHKKNEGLTKALIDGCRAAAGIYVARIDAGDAMAPERLAKQKQVLDTHGDCMFVSCWTEFCGPEWEPLWLKKLRPVAQKPVGFDPYHPESLEGFVPHHGSVMFRKSVYDSVGGYRKEFYYGQDWDLWYRLSETGKYFLVPEVLYRVRLFPESISMTAKSCQDAVHKCSEGAFEARKRGKDEKPWLDRAALIRPTKLNRPKNIEQGYYFMGEALRRNKDRKCLNYFQKAIRENPLQVRSYIRLAQALIYQKQ